MDNFDQQVLEEDDSEDEWEEWDRRRRITVIQVLIHVIQFISLYPNMLPRSIKEKIQFIKSMKRFSKKY